MNGRDVQLSTAQAAVDAVVDLKVTRDAYRALESMVTVGVAMPPERQTERVELGAMLNVLNRHFDQRLARAEAAVRAVP